MVRPEESRHANDFYTINEFPVVSHSFSQQGGEESPHIHPEGGGGPKPVGYGERPGVTCDAASRSGMEKHARRDPFGGRLPDRARDSARNPGSRAEMRRVLPLDRIGKSPR